MDYKNSIKPRSAELYPGANGRLTARWQLTDSKLIDAVTLTLPPIYCVPIIFVPGIMGSNLCDSKGDPVWLLNSIKGVPAGLAWGWARKKAGARQAILHPERTGVYRSGAVPEKSVSSGLTKNEFLRRGWGEVSEASYHAFLLWLDSKMNGDRNPANWADFTHPSLGGASTLGEKLARKLPSGMTMKMENMPMLGDNGSPVEPVRSDELLKRAKSSFPIYAFGYNWLASNKDAALLLEKRLNEVIAENNIGAIKCSQVILVTHSMGGLVARACSQLSGMSKKIVGIVHGVMPATGAAVAYRRCKVGMRDEDFKAGLVIGSDGKEVTAVFAQSPGALQLLPAESYGPKWLETTDPTGKILTALPIADPYEEIYLQRDKWWGLVNEEWLSPKDGIRIDWDTFVMNVLIAKSFHRKLEKKYHHNTYVFYGGGPKIGSYAKIRWSIKHGDLPGKPSFAPAPHNVPGLNHREVRTDGSNNLYIGTGTVIRTATRGDSPVLIESVASQWSMRCAQHDSTGDGTVPIRSGRAPKQGGGASVIQQFEVDGIQHEPAFRDYSLTQQITYYAITKLAAFANFS